MEVDSEQGRIPLFDTGPATLSEKGEPRFSKAASNITCPDFGGFFQKSPFA